MEDVLTCNMNLDYLQLGDVVAGVGEGAGVLPGVLLGHSRGH